MHRKDNLSLSFNEAEHRYVCSNGFEYKSVTATIADYFTKFNADLIIKNMMQSSNWRQSKYYGMTPDEIKTSWTEAARIGIYFHSGLETMIKYCCDQDFLLDADRLIKISSSKEIYANLPDWPLDGQYTNQLMKEFEFFHNFVKTRPFYEYCVSEARLFFPEIGLAGTADLITFDREGNCKIYDWKRINELKTMNEKKGKTICFDLPDCNASHYHLQLNLYRYMTESCYTVQGLPPNVVEVGIVLFHERNTDFIIVPVERDERVCLISNC